MIKLVIFDYDGLMVNSEEVIFSSLKDIFKQYNHKLTWEYYTQYIGLPVAKSLPLFYKDHPIKITFDEFYKLRNSKVHEYLQSKSKIMPGLIPLLKKLRKLKIALAICTSGKREYIESSLKKFNLKNYFNSVTCIDDVKRGKPYPDLILKTLEVEKVPNNKALILEDSPNGIECSYNAGVFSIAVPTKGMDYNRFKKADLILSNLSTVNKFIDFFV